MPTKLCGFSLSSVSVAALCASLLWLPADTAQAQSAKKDGIADLIGTSEKPAAPLSKAKPAAAPAEADPREGDLSYEQARQLMAAIDNILNDVSEQRAAAKKLPGKDEFLVTPLWTETKEDRETKVRALLDSALGIVTDVPVVEVQKKIEGFRRNIRELEERIVTLKEKQLSAPKDSMMPGVLTDTVASLGNDIEDAKRRIEENRANIVSAKGEIQTALAKAGLGLDADQLDLLIDSVLSGDLVRLAATFQAAKVIDGHLGKLMSGASENTGAARKYFAMHAALFALLVHAQDAAIAKIDTQYMPKLDAILKDIAAAKARTASLLRADNRPDQQRALEANRDSQKLAEEAARGYRRYLTQQREQIASARTRAAHDLRIADNTFETVEASLELRNLMRDSSASFEAIQKLEAPTFEQIFKNEELRREFENLTRKLDAPTS
jgi:polyhydroxyalkanoate synthesis regulator phasin